MIHTPLFATTPVSGYLRLPQIIGTIAASQRKKRNNGDHGTAQRNLSSIKGNGIVSMNRTLVHLSKDRETAIAVGKRHGQPVVLTIMAGKMHRDGFLFYLSENGVWLTDHVPVKYISGWPH